MTVDTLGYLLALHVTPAVGHAYEVASQMRLAEVSAASEGTRYNQLFRDSSPNTFSNARP